MNSELNVAQIHSVIDTDEDLLEINQHIEAYKIIMEECRDRIENHKTRMEHNKTRMELVIIVIYNHERISKLGNLPIKNQLICFLIF